MKIAVVFLLLAVSAQLPSCGSMFGAGAEDKVFGFVEEKYVAPERAGAGPVPWIVVNKVDYQVPWEFYRQVNIGDLVRYENGRWTIVRKYVP